MTVQIDYALVDVNCRRDEELAKANEFIDAVENLARAAGGEPPLPERPSILAIEELRREVGNAQLLRIAESHDDLKPKIEQWKETRARIEARRPSWELVERLARHALDLPAASAALAEVEAVRRDRLLLAPGDPVATVRKKLVAELRGAVTSLAAEHVRIWKEAVTTLEASGVWKKLAPEDAAAILSSCQLTQPKRVDVATDEALLAELDRMSLSQRRTEIDAVRNRAMNALNLAAKKLEPKVRMVALEQTTLSTKEEVVAWAERQQKTLLKELADGPVLPD